MRIGYSFWGFLGDGITDTPDGGRSHRRTLIDGLIDAGHDIVFLQPDRDLTEAGDTLNDRYRFDAGLPDLDVLFLEWRWPIPGRNTTWCGAPGHTCDLHRQQQVIDHYTQAGDVRTIIWDKDRRLDPADPLRTHSAVTVCEPARYPTAGAVSLPFPVADQAIDTADPMTLAARPRPVQLAYVGNQYDRDDHFDRFFAPAAAVTPHLVAGKWPNTGRWPHVHFTGRVPFPDVAKIYDGAVATVLLLPDRYRRVGHITQRLFEAVLAGCLPLMPADVRAAIEISPPELIVANADEVITTVRHLATIVGTPEHTRLINAWLTRLTPFRASAQLKTLTDLLGER